MTGPFSARPESVPLPRETSCPVAVPLLKTPPACSAFKLSPLTALQLPARSAAAVHVKPILMVQCVDLRVKTSRRERTRVCWEPSLKMTAISGYTCSSGLYLWAPPGSAVDVSCQVKTCRTRLPGTAGAAHSCTWIAVPTALPFNHHPPGLQSDT